MGTAVPAISPAHYLDMRRCGHRCELCRRIVPPWQNVHYRAGDRADLERRGLQACTFCGRLGCPDCLAVVEEQVDDFFLMQLACRQCVSRAVPWSG